MVGLLQFASKNCSVFFSFQIFSLARTSMHESCLVFGFETNIFSLHPCAIELYILLCFQTSIYYYKISILIISLIETGGFNPSRQFLLAWPTSDCLELFPSMPNILPTANHFKRFLHLSISTFSV